MTHLPNKSHLPDAAEDIQDEWRHMLQFAHTWRREADLVHGWGAAQRVVGPRCPGDRRIHRQALSDGKNEVKMRTSNTEEYELYKNAKVVALV